MFAVKSEKIRILVQLLNVSQTADLAPGETTPLANGQIFCRGYFGTDGTGLVDVFVL